MMQDGSATLGREEAGSLVEGVLAQARRTPEAVAVEDLDTALRYADLEQRSRQVAHALARAGITAGQAVAVCLPRSWQLVCAMLGILRLGATVVPIDRQSPPERIAHMLADSASRALIVDPAQAGPEKPGPEKPSELPPSDLPRLSVASLLEDSADSDRALPLSPPATRCFVFYTSGTTGRPKGVEVTHAGILRLARPGYLDIRAGDRYACLSNPAFDALSFEVWVPLLTGGRCVILRDEDLQSPPRLARRLAQTSVDTLFVTVSLFNALVDPQPDCFSAARQVLIGGEQLNARLIRRWYQANPNSPTQLYNAYGPTESSTFALSYPIPRGFDGDLLPIGRPLPGTGVSLLREDGQEAAPGEAAELLLSGEGLALGYLQLPAETARAFVLRPGPDGKPLRHYRTGDLVRRNPAGELEYLGRRDRQVKVRGFRIEPGEVERQILAHPAVGQAYVCVRHDTDKGVNELLAYLVPREGLDFAGFQHHLAARLPVYMRPHRLYLRDALPLNANGKIDQAALLGGDAAPWRADEGSAIPATPWQQSVLALVGEVLGIDDLTLDDHWIACGGDSLKALRLRFEAQRRWGGGLTQADILHGSFAELAARLEHARSAPVSGYPPLPAPRGARSAPATSEQQRLWLLQQQAPSSTAYNVTLPFRLHGPVDRDALRTALCQLVARHAALRSAFESTPDGLWQTVAEPFDPCCFELGGRGDWQAVARHLCATPFDLSVPRLFLVCWVPATAGSEGGEGGVLLLHLHHIVVDGWSLNLLFQDLSVLYAAALRDEVAEADLSAVPTPLDHAAWQADWFAHPAYQAQRTSLAALHAAEPDRDPPLAAGTDDAAPAARLHRDTLDAVRQAALDGWCATHGLTRFQVLVCLFAWSLYGVTGRAHPRIASPVANRPLREVEASVGMFANTVLLPLSVAPALDLPALLARQAATVRTVLDHQDVALAHAVADDSALRQTDGPLFDFLFVLENTDFSMLTLPACQVAPLCLAPAEAKCALALSVQPSDGGLDCHWEYDPRQLDEAQVQALAQLFRQGLDALTGGATPTLAALVAPYRRTLAEPGRGAPMTRVFDSVSDGFRHQARLSPERIALVDRSRQLSYAELDAQASALAASLLASYRRELSADGPLCVALYLDASVEHVVALLALARLDLTIVPLDPAYPPALLRQVLAQCEPLCVLFTEDKQAALEQLDGGRTPRYPLRLATAPSAVELPRLERRRPLYTLFTSGSTGVPKGVQVADATLCNLLQWQRDGGGMAARADTLQFSMLSFDVSFQEIFTTLCAGATLHLVSPGWRQDVSALLAYLEQAEVARIFMPYVALQLLAETAVSEGRYPARLREVITAGEQLLCTDAIRRWFDGMPHARLFNHYGPTETHVVSSLCLSGPTARWPARPAIGRPVANAWLRVVDESDLPVPAGCTGQLLIGGMMAARCYLGDAALNQARFVELPDADGQAQPFYRSGDLAYFDREGLLHYLGRDDQQVKVSGHRLELGQVEAALLRHPGVSNAVVVQERGGGELVACLQCGDVVPSVEEMEHHLAPLLPPHARIARFRRVYVMPRTASGKLDRRNVLQAPGEALPRQVLAPVALSPLERRLTELFEAVIGQPITLDQRFFDAGATSLGLMRFQLRCRAELAQPFSIPDLFEHVTIRRLADFLRARDSIRPANEPQAQGDEDARIAIVGMAVNLPGAGDLAAFWDLVREGRRGIAHFAAEDGLVGARSQMDGLLAFDPEHFGISRQEARLMDPQQRHLLMSCVQALAHAGLGDGAGRIGLVASCGENTYFQSMLREGDAEQLPDGFQMALHHDKDFLATKVAYHLNLTGPAFTVQAACASSLVAVHVAAGLLRQGDADVALAGGVLVDPLLTPGYRYRPQHIFSPDGHCRPFSDDAGGTIGGSGVGVVVLKPLQQALHDGDTVYAVIAGSALNNDGADKQSYSAPSVSGQREAIRAALRRSGYRGADIGYLEAHGTGTRLGDPIEVGALRQAFEVEEGRCALASVKSQIGHLGAAAGVVGLIRAALAVHHGLIPPNVDFRRLNPQIGEADPAPFYIPTAAAPWPAGRQRVAGVSSFGIGGTNAHLVLAEAPDGGRTVEAPACLLLSASSEAALREDARRIADYLAAHPQRYPAVLRHLQAGRLPRRWRWAATCADAAAAVEALRAAVPVKVPPLEGVLDAAGLSAAEAVTAWLAGQTPRWPAGPAQAPWDFPPPAFALSEHDFPRRAPVVAPPPALRQPADRWLHRQAWEALPLPTPPVTASAAWLVCLSAAPLDDATREALRPAYARLVQVLDEEGFQRQAADRYTVDAADPASLRQLFDALAADGAPALEWLHALPLSRQGKPDAATLDAAYRSCVDSPAALVRAWTEAARRLPLRVWWLSHRAQPVQGGVMRPELGLLAGASTVIAQEHGLSTRWLDLPHADLAESLPGLRAVLGAADTLPERVALRQGMLWQPVFTPVPAPRDDEAIPAQPVLLAEQGVYLILGGTGGIGASIAAYLLSQTRGRVILAARGDALPARLALWAERVEMLTVNLADPTQASAALNDLLRREPRLDGVIHAVGTAAGGLIARRDATALRQAAQAKLQGAWLLEALVDAYRPAFAVYCSSMSALFGGVGQLDYAAGNGLLDGLAQQSPAAGTPTVRLGINWDIWRDVGMAQSALQADPLHQAHLRVGLGVEEGQQVFARALQLRLPRLLVCTTDPTEARQFYAPPRDDGGRPAAVTPPAGRLRAHLTDCLCRWLGLPALDAAASLYDLGADSLTLLDLIAEVQQHGGVDLPLSRLGHAVSLDEVMGLVAAATPAGGADAAAEGAAPVSLEVWQQGSGRELLCLIHPVGGDIQAYRALVAALDPSLTVCLIADPALQQASAPAWSVAERARHYLLALQQRFPRPDWQWQLGGWSFGAWVALAMSAQLEAAGDAAAQAWLIDPPPPGAGPAFRAYTGGDIRAVFLNELGLRLPEAADALRDAPQARDGLTPEASRYVERLIRCCEANLASMAGFEPPRLSRTPCHLFVAGEATPGLPAGPAGMSPRQAWQALLAQLASWTTLDTDHYGIVRPPHAQRLAEAVNAACALPTAC